MRRLLQAAVCCCALLGCKGEETGPNEPASIEFTALPSPSVVLGDTLRDTTGVVSPASAKAFSSGNELLVGATVVYAVLDRGARVDSLTGIIVGDSIRDTPVRVVATVGGLQSAPIPLFVVSRPDSAAVGTLPDTVRYSLADSTKNVSGNLAVRVLHKPATGAPTAVRSYPVSFTIVRPSNALAAQLLGDNNRPAFVDTTGTDGVAALKVRVRPEHFSATRDSVVVLASVRHRGAHVPGSPVRIVLPYRPLTP